MDCDYVYWALAQAALTYQRSYMQSAGDIIRERRIRKGWSQTVLAELVGLSAEMIQRIEYGERIPTEGEANMIAGMLGIEHADLLAAFNAARRNPNEAVPQSSYQMKWDTAHPASYAGEVWIQVYPATETRHLQHEFTLEWGVWARTGTIQFAKEQPYIYLAHYKHNDGLGLPLFLTLSQPCYVVFGRGVPSHDGLVIDINRGWRRTEPPPPGQFFRYVWHFGKWYIKYLLRRKPM